MRPIVFALVGLVACGGDPFVMAAAPIDGGAQPDVLVEDAAVRPLQVAQPSPIVDASPDVATADAGHVDLPTDASKPEPEPSTVEAAPPVEACAPPTGSLAPYCPSPAMCGGGCATQQAPGYVFRIDLHVANGCIGLPTPAECQGCSYGCACVLAHPPAGACNAGATVTCNDSTGLPTLICN